ncbi:hypothetical protein JTT00_16835 [Clostridium botulinum]|nr:hypothetical protein [Clostridium botulinum]MCS4467239.1 hypothetical protein [Clostridium botulinum]MCS4477647.1 hypothetical protein [Clostridium botulinum]MCS4515677.1 hypothetical protein [Clostridium botulinum]MCS4527372.1 hypothetical protein [Clostridium botulinum]
MDKKSFYIKNGKRKKHIKDIKEKCIECDLCVKNCSMLKEFGGNPKKYLVRYLKRRILKLYSLILALFVENVEKFALRI